MKIAIMIPALHEGGVETGAIDLSLSLHNHGHSIIVISDGGPLVKKIEGKGIRHLKWPIHRKNPFMIIWMAIRLSRFILNENVEVLHAKSRVPAWVAYLACKVTNRKWLTTCHGYYRVHKGSAVMGWSDKVIVVSDMIKQHMMNNFNVPEEKIVVIPRGLDIDKFKYHPPPLRTPPVIGILGRITPIKGHVDFLHALALLKKRKVDFIGHIIGGTTKPHFYKELQDLSQSLGLSKEVRFMGYRDDVPECLQEMDVLVLATTYPEAFGRVIIEAQSSGIPVIATGVGGVPEIIEDGVNGYLIEPHDPEGMAEKILHVFNQRDEIDKIRIKARKIVEERYQNHLMIEKKELVYNEFIQNKKILITKIGSLGDMVLISPSLRSIRRKFPKASITLLTDVKNRALVERCPYINNIIYCTKMERKIGFLRILKTIAKQKFDISIDFQNTYWTHAIAFFSRIPHRIGYGRKGGWLLLNQVPESTTLSPVQHQYELLKPLDIHPNSDKLECWISPRDEKTALKKIRSQGVDETKPIVCINIGASWNTKKWRSNHISKFCDMLKKQRSQQVLLVGTNNDIPLDQEILRLCHHPVHSLVGKTSLGELCAVIKLSHYVVSTDSLPLHIAAAFDKPTIGLFGPTIPERHRPPAKNLHVLSEKVDCGPCYKSTCSHYSCMVNLQPQRVMDTFTKL